MKWLLIILALASAPGYAQSPAAKRRTPPTKAKAAPVAKWPIASLAVEGNHTYTPEQILAVAGLAIGQRAGKPEFEAARDRLVASGAFESVGYKFAPNEDGTSYAASFQVAEVGPAYPVRFEELGVPDQDLQSLLQAHDPLFSMTRLPATKPVLDRQIARIQEYLAARGVKETVAARVMPVGPEQLAIIFRPARNRPSVAEVSFEGNHVLSESILRGAIAGIGIGALYTEDSFRELLNNAIRPLYEARGRVRVQFVRLHTRPVTDVQGLLVTVTVYEGESYTLGRIAIEGPTPVSAPALLKTGDFKTGDVANFDRINDGLERIRKAVRHIGYLEAKVTTDRKIDDAKKTVDVAVRIQAGPQFNMGKLDIKGLDLDGEAEMRRIWTIKEAKPFDPEYPDMFLNRVREQGMFDNMGKTKAEVKINSEVHTADVTLTFAGDTPGAKPGRRGGRGGPPDEERN